MSSTKKRPHGPYGALLLAALTSVLAVGAGGSTSAEPVPAVVVERGGDIYAIAIDGSRTVRLTDTPLRESMPAVSPDGERIAFSLVKNSYGFDGDLGTIRVDGSDRRWLTRSFSDGSPAWAPDGRTIFFVRSFGTPFGGSCGSIYRISVDGGRARRVTNSLARPRSPHSHQNPAVAPDGRRIAFTDWNGCSGGFVWPRLRVVHVNGRPTPDLWRLRRNRFLSHRDPERNAPAWSPDGKRIVYKKNGDLTIANRDGSGERRIAPASGVTHRDRPSWSPDGQWIAFAREGQGPPSSIPGSLFIVRPDGTGLRRLGTTPRGNYSVANYSVGGWLPSLPK